MGAIANLPAPYGMYFDEKKHVESTILHEVAPKKKKPSYGKNPSGVFFGGVECFWIRRGSHTELPATPRSPTVLVLLYVGIVRVHFAYLNLQILKNTKHYTGFPHGYRRKKYAYQGV